MLNHWGELGAFAGFEKNRGAMLRVIRNHRRAAGGEIGGCEGLSVPPVPLDSANCPDVNPKGLYQTPRRRGDGHATRCRGGGPGLGQRAGEGRGARLSQRQATVVAPTGTIGLVMDCDTTGIEPDLSLVKFKKLAGGGDFKIINRIAPVGLKTLGYKDEEIEDVVRYAVGRGTLDDAPGVNHQTLCEKGFVGGALKALEEAVSSAPTTRSPPTCSPTSRCFTTPRASMPTRSRSTSGRWRSTRRL